jgi:prolipoprotein diacylglyceryltransferase
MKQISFGNLLWESTVKSWGGILTFLGFVGAILVFYLVPEESNIKLKHILPAIIVAFFFVVVALRAAWAACQYSSVNMPRVMYVKDAPKAYQGSCALFLVEPTPLLSHDAIVSVYYLEDDLERLVGVGKVINVQNDKKVQILITENYDFGEKLNQIMNNSKDELKKLIVKASVPSFILEAISNGR